MFPALNLRSPPASALLERSGSIPPEIILLHRALFYCNNICLKLFVHLQTEQDGEMNQMTLPSRHRVRDLCFGDLRQHAWSRSRNICCI